eukprot:NODE_414_length_9102_cov_0.404754.p4 type:complete len:207 gc:universal NODE_414_length_9102_cov_0.404754:1485-865(-)
MKNILLFGPGGCGKGTLAAQMVKNYENVTHISMGDVLRKSKNHQITNTIKKGMLVPDNYVFDEIELYIQKYNLLDGFPRTVDQLHLMIKRKWSISTVLNIQLPPNVILDRLQYRRIHPASGRIYHLLYNPPKILGLDDDTGEPLIQRADDQPHIVKKRLKIYEDITFPILEECKKLRIPVHTFSNLTSDENFKEIKMVLDKMMTSK